VEEAIRRPIIDLTLETPRNKISEVDTSDSDSDSNITITRGAPLLKGWPIDPLLLVIYPSRDTI
jgi:hypothetical protein